MTLAIGLGIVAAFAVGHAIAYARAQPNPSRPSVQTGALPPAFASVSFLVPGWNCASDLEAFVAAFRALSIANKELILCVGGEDGSEALAQQLAGPDVRVVGQRPGEGKQRALQRIAPMAVGEFVYLTDIDCRPDDGAVLPLVERLERGDVAAVSGGVRPRYDQRDNAFVLSLYAIERVGAHRTGLEASGLRGANAVVSREALRRTGDFAQEAPSGTDYTLAKEMRRAGLRIAFMVESEMPTELPGSLGVYVKKQARWLRNVLVLGLRYGQWSEVSAVVVTLSLPIAILVALAAGFAWPPMFLVAVILPAHAIMNRLRYARVSGLKVSSRAVATTVLGDLGAGLVAVRQAVVGRMTWS